MIAKSYKTKTDQFADADFKKKQFLKDPNRSECIFNVKRIVNEVKHFRKV